MQICSTTYPPLCIAHRGFSSHYPENTRPALDAALKAPIAGIELDVQLSADDHLVIYHNRSLYMVGGGMKRVGNQKLDVLQSFDYGGWFHPSFQGQSLLLLDELLQHYGNKTHLLVEVKLRGGDRGRMNLLMQKTIDAVKAHEMIGSVSILCFDLDLLRYGHQYEPRIAYVWNQQKEAVLAPDHDFLFAYSLRHNLLTRDYVGCIQDRGKPVFSFTCDSERSFQKSVAAGVNGIMANNPSQLAQRLAGLR